MEAVLNNTFYFLMSAFFMTFFMWGIKIMI